MPGGIPLDTSGPVPSRIGLAYLSDIKRLRQAGHGPDAPDVDDAIVRISLRQPSVHGIPVQQFRPALGGYPVNK